MKIKKIEVKNFKAISEEVAEFDGCSAIISAGNNKGKTSLLSGLIDRFRGLKPDIILKEGSEKGFNNIELTDGSRIEWKFTEKTESFAFITSEGIKMTTGVLKGIGEKYFGVNFDIDRFILSSSTIQSTMLSNLIGLDLSDVDRRYKLAYDKRTDANREVLRLRSMNMQKPEPIERPDVEAIKEELSAVKMANYKLRQKWEKENDILRTDIENFNARQDEIAKYLISCKGDFANFSYFMSTIFAECINIEKAEKILNSIERPKEKKVFKKLPDPNYEDTESIEARLELAYRDLSAFNSYSLLLKQYNDWVKESEKATKKAVECDNEVKKILAEKEDMIKGANIPEEFTFSENGLLFNGLPINNQQLSTSSRYIAALKLGSLAIGKIKTLHFEASSLDRNSLQEIEDWAVKNNLQLLIERPDFDGGEIKYEII